MSDKRRVGIHLSFDAPDERDGVASGNDDGEDNMGEESANLTGRKKKLFELRLKMNEARKANQSAMVAEKKKTEVPPAESSRGMFKQKWIEQRNKKIGNSLDADGLDMSKTYMLDSQESAEAKYNRMKEADRDASNIQYGKAPKLSDDKIERMVKELKDRDEKHQSFSRRRKFHEEKDIDSINDRNEHFNKKIERAFGKYTLEIKNNLERGTALPD
ncbi:pre-mRNA-splicing factor syf2-like [Solanum pennellii]|uniref:Pre-mRNA-splicing factor SYF2 n=1 Tax=Solanum pennellii TaxID=28526 RepID=A0ABM1VH99_SOLPN|nr:pre-mRNA-splicing factor syf2-like [Solanum pennellii]